MSRNDSPSASLKGGNRKPNPLLIVALLLLLLALLVRVVWQMRPHPPLSSSSPPSLAMDDSAAELPLDPPPLPTDKLTSLRAAYLQVQAMRRAITLEEQVNEKLANEKLANGKLANEKLADAKIQAAQRAQDTGDLWQAEELARDMRQRAPNNRTATLILATCLRRTSRFAEAEVLYQGMLKADFRDSDAYLGMAETTFAANRRPEAFSWLARGVAEGAQSVVSLCTFAHRYQDWKDYPKAEEAAQKALRIAPGDASAALQLASAQVEGGQLEAGRQTLEALLQRDPNNGLAHRLLAVALINADIAHQDTNRARALLERAVELNPKDLDIYRPAAVIYRQQHLYRLAAQAYDAVLHLDPLSIDGRYGLGQVYALLGKAELSKQQLAIYKLLDERRRRVGILSEDIVHHPTSAEAHAALARYYEQIDEPGRALPEYQSAATLAPGDPRHQQDIRRFYSRLGWELPKR